MGDHLCIGPDRIAVWTGGTDLGPVDSPSSYPSRVRLNSTQDLIGVYPTARTGTVYGTEWLATENNARKITLFTHGLDYRPFLYGHVTVSGINLPVQGSIFVDGGGHWFWSYSIGADSSVVYLNILRSSSTYGVPPTISYTLYVSNYGVNANGSLRRPPYFNGVDVHAGVSPSYLRAGYVDTAFRYPYRDATGLTPIANGRTISAGIGWTGTGAGNSGGFSRNSIGLGWRYSVQGHVVRRNAVSSTVSGAVGNNTSFNASVTRLSI